MSPDFVNNEDIVLDRTAHIIAHDDLGQQIDIEIDADTGALIWIAQTSNSFHAPLPPDKAILEQWMSSIHSDREDLVEETVEGALANSPFLWSLMRDELEIFYQLETDEGIVVFYQSLEDSLSVALVEQVEGGYRFKSNAFYPHAWQDQQRWLLTGPKQVSYEYGPVPGIFFGFTQADDIQGLTLRCLDTDQLFEGSIHDGGSLRIWVVENPAAGMPATEEISQDIFQLTLELENVQTKQETFLLPRTGRIDRDF